MKTLSFIFLSSFFLTGISEAKPACYYWVVETNSATKNGCVIRVYNTRHELIYTEHVEKSIDITDRKVNRSLNRKARKLSALKDK